LLDEKSKLFPLLAGLKEDFSQWKELKKRNYKYYNILEGLLLNVDTITEEQAA